MNTQETELFHKSDILYNYYQANLHANKEKLLLLKVLWMLLHYIEVE